MIKKVCYMRTYCTLMFVVKTYPFLFNGSNCTLHVVGWTSPFHNVTRGHSSNIDLNIHGNSMQPTISRHAVPAMQSSAPAARRRRRRRQETMHPPRNGRRNQSAQLGDELNCCTDSISNGHVWKSCLNCALHSSKHYLVENILRYIWMMESGLISNIAIL